MRAAVEKGGCGRGAPESVSLVADRHPREGRWLLPTGGDHRNVVPWQRAGWQVDVCPLTVDGRIDRDAAEKMLTPDHTMVAFAHVSNVLGSPLNVARATELDRKSVV